ncbi:transporter, major facilitator family protein [Dictyocaulus viviparus]|uniref:Transporter, major facilitator family protein n=1 Tax=Dictyocaulus viviparus TaxID=29172 RepID=A0A0D8YAD3_DICVI|nr:transporter, major facilitator family protein [Dictyocaulus viviparus]
MASMIPFADDSEQQELVDEVQDEKQVKNLDEFITLGWYCTIVLFAGEFMTLTSVSCMVYMVYAGISPAVISCGSFQFNSSSEACEELLDLRKTTGCIPNLEYQFKSVNVEFDLLCDDSKLVKNSISVQMFGVLVGALISGQLSDRYGRKSVLIGCLLGVGLFSLGTAVSMTLIQFTVLRAIVGVFTGGLSSVQGVFLIENIPKEHRMWINAVITWSPNFIIYPVIAFYCHDWRRLAFFSSFICLISIINLCFLYESPRWLIHRGRISDARRILVAIRKINRKTCEIEAGEIESMLRHEQDIFNAKLKKNKHYTYYHLVCTWKYIRWTVTVCSGLFITSLVNYSLLFNMEKLSGSLYWNNTIFGIIRWGVNILVGMSDYFFHFVGRKLINFLAISFIIGALAIICGLYIGGITFSMIFFEVYLIIRILESFKTINIQTEKAWIIRYCTIGVTSMTSQLYVAKFMIANELFPTAVRNIAVSVISVSSRFGTIIAPQLFYLADTLPVLPYLVLTLLSIVDCICFQCLLPETKGTNLENHLPPKKQRFFYRERNSIGL